MIEEKYRENLSVFTEAEIASFPDLRICVAGCGGLGGFVIEHLARLGVGHITAVDGDSFVESNLNRQLFATEKNLGESKAKAAAKRINDINSHVNVQSIQTFLTEKNARAIIRGHDAVIDAFDNVEARCVLERAAAEENIPMVHGAIGGWYGQVAVVMPDKGIMEKLYEDAGRGEEADIGNPPFTPALVAAIQVAECMKLLVGRPTLVGKILTIDLLSQEYDILEI